MRVVFDELGNLQQQTDYYPFGLAIDRNAPVQTPAARNGVNRYLYNKKELQVGTGYVDYGARQYDPTSARWMAVDPLSEKYVHNSTYAFSENKVTTHIELEGLEGVSFNEYLQKTNSLPRYEMAEPLNPAIGSGTKAGVSGTISTGMQAGTVDKRFGMGIGVYVNFGSTEIATAQLDLADGNKGEVISENNQVTITQGGELQLGALGFETSTNRELTNSGKDLTVRKSSGVSIGAVKFSDEKVETYSKDKNGYSKTGESNFRSTTIAETKSIKALGASAEFKSGVTLGGGGGIGKLLTIDLGNKEKMQPM